MQSIVGKAKPKYLIDEKGNKKAVVLDIKEYKSIMELIEDLEDANDLLRAEREATAFIPYDKFRKTWLKG
jgi:PHD/YefM family antitoxin component YafN of YafNO toxin-antitoxin module